MRPDNKYEGEARPRKGWKEHLLRSGVPLEYEVAKIIVDAGIDVHADFGYLRRDVDGTKEMSVDIQAIWSGPPKNSSHMALHMLVECKHRSPEKCFVFMEDPNRGSYATGGSTLNGFPHFTPYYVPGNSLENGLHIVYKGVEIHENGAVEEDLRRGIQQLRYATPAALRYAFEWALDSGLGEWPTIVFFTKILVTNAPIRVLSSNISIEDIRAAEHIADISTETETVVMFTDYGPDYADHFKSAFKDRWTTQAAKRLRKQLKQGGKAMRLGFDDPAALIEDLSRAGRADTRAVSTQFFITTLDGLPTLLDEIKGACIKSYKRRSKKPPRWHKD